MTEEGQTSAVVAVVLALAAGKTLAAVSAGMVEALGTQTGLTAGQWLAEKSAAPLVYWCAPGSALP
jgi:hypothetical protein